jgi:DNA repair protein RecN (Recombination protein N)
MLSDLHVRDLGVIRDVSVTFGPRMTALTGETGAGKTLLVQALQLVLGGRAGAGLVRVGADEAAVEARFVGAEVTGAGGADVVERVLARSFPAAGRSRAWVDGRMVPVGALEEAGEGLVDIHGQHDRQALLNAAGQRGALDVFARSDLEPLGAARRLLAEIDRGISALGGDERQRARELDLIRYQITEIDKAGITGPDEDAHLAAEEGRLADAGALREVGAQAAAALDGDDGVGVGSGATNAADAVAGALSSLGGRPMFAEEERRLREALAELRDVASGLRGAVESLEDDPARLEEVQGRRRLLAELRRKYGDTLAEVLAFGEAARGRAAALEQLEHEAAALERRRAEAVAAVARHEEALREVRARAAPGLAAAVTERLRTLAMPEARFEVAVGDEGAGDAVQFLLAANPGEPAQPLSRVASGGELSRVMLGMRLVVEGGAPTMLFDEVDAGVGGAAALALARALAGVASGRQVLVVTHLPQVAAAAHHQVAVRKAVDADGRAVTLVEHVEGEARVVELSRMLSGHPDSATARAHAEELLASFGAPAPGPRRGSPGRAVGRRNERHGHGRPPPADAPATSV